MKFKTATLILTCLISYCACEEEKLENAPRISLQQGQLIGKVSNDYNGNPYYSYQGIPYARPPLGDLRFKAPRAPEPWEGVLNATKPGHSCPQLLLGFGLTTGDEDCLFVNVYTKNVPSKNGKLAPVMFWIYGGAFVFGSGKNHIYGPEFLMTEDVVVVTFNYRLNALGFLSFEDSEVGVPGNAGLKDQVMALRWVQKNIEKFGGDPNQVTIFGESAGSASVNFHVLSPMSKGLFHRAISQSGVASNPWVLSARRYKRLAEYLGFESDNQKKIYEFLKTVPAVDIIKAERKIFAGNKLHTEDVAPFTPVIEIPTEDEPTFISEHPDDILEKGTFNQVPYIIGYNAHEGMLSEVLTDLGPIFSNPEKLIPYDMDIEKGTPRAKEIGKKIKKFYYGSSIPTYLNYDKFIKYRTDTLFLIKIFKVAKAIASKSSEPVYFYRFNYVTKLNLAALVGKVIRLGVTTHADDLGYLWHLTVTPKTLKSGSNEYIGNHRMVKLWTTFAKYGDPNKHEVDPLLDVTWSPVKSNEFNYLDIKPDMKAAINPEEDRMQFWEALYDDVKNNKI